jgi:hypothetical protein
MVKWSPIKNCKECKGKGYWYSTAADKWFRCECYKKTKKYKRYQSDRKAGKMIRKEREALYRVLEDSDCIRSVW